MDFIEGIVERITYHNPENGYTVLRFQVEKFQNLTTAVGNAIGINAGAFVRLKGEWTNHPKHGKQFNFQGFETIRPATLMGLQKYLGSGMIKGVGPRTAKRLVEHFGLDILRVMDEEPARLTEVPKVGKKMADKIGKRWQEQKEIQNVMIFLQGHGVSPAYAVKIYKKYGDQSIELVSENPYRMAREIWGIGFKTADKIAQQLGFRLDDPFRMQSGVRYALETLSEEGHVFYPVDELLDKAAALLGVERAATEPALITLKDTAEFMLEDHDDYTAAYLTPLYRSEIGVANRLRDLLARPVVAKSKLVEPLLERIEQQAALQLSAQQTQAILDAAISSVFVLTGGPGTGKTTCLRTMVALFEQLGKRVMLASPTGRAAKRLNEVTGRPAKTLHRLLEFNPVQKQGEPTFKRNQDNPLDVDVVIVDEVSMVDTVLMNNLVKAVPPGAQLVLVGDSDQLPSVGPGNVLQDVLGSDRVPMARLTEVFRQAQKSLIVMNAHRIRQDQWPELIVPDGQRVSDCYFVPANDPETVVAEVRRLAGEVFPRARFQPDDIQVLTPMNRGETGANNLNTVLQDLLNPVRPDQAVLQRGSRHFRVGDRVIQLRNDYDRNVFNGDVGKVTSIDNEEQVLEVTFPDQETPVLYDFADSDELALAYALSIHKAQGSEYPGVILVLTTQHFTMLQKNLVYTAITRAKRRLVIVGSKKAILIALKNRQARLRYTSLARRLREAIADPDAAWVPLAAERAGRYLADD